MNFEEFEQMWPDHAEGESKSNKWRLHFLEEERKSLPTGRWVWAGVPVTLATVRFFEGSGALAVGCAGLLLAFEIIDLLVRLLRKNHEILHQIELVKGSARENRWATHWCHETAMKAQGKNEFGIAHR